MPNLHWHPRGGWRYKNPKTGRYTYWGKSVSRQAANDAARILNQKLSPKSSLVDQVLSGEATSLRSLIQLHIDEELSKRSLAEKTRETYLDYLGRLKREAGDLDVSGASTRDLVVLLRRICKGERSRQVYRTLLVDLFNTAIGEGLCEFNPAAAMRNPRVERKRQRLTREGYAAIYAKAEPWLRNAMDLGLQTLQRREDLVALMLEADTGSCLRVEQQKTGARLEIEIGPELRSVLNRCKDNIASPFILHRLPEKLRPREKRAKKRGHHTQVLPEQLTRAFAEARDASEFYAVIPKGETPPSFHEIRSLGAALYRQAGWAKDKVQALLGHDDSGTTSLYLAGHEMPWERTAAAGLVINDV